MPEADKAIVLFDGICNVCDQTVLFIIDHDPREHFLFAPLSSEVAREALKAEGLDADKLESIALLEAGRVYTHSDAALQIARKLRFPWSLLSLLRIVPRGLRDYVYRAFAARRYALFGKLAQCRVPTPALRRRFLA
ncbi:MAG: hypothetical protein RL385_2932 [Pseudomonadota bacterium]|jgi:predicted DCC family thiol-disulfide oxidoreductase YuxK